MSSPSPRKLRFSELPTNRPTQFELVGTEDELAAIRDDLGISEMRRLRFKGQIATEGQNDWKLDGHLGVTVIQPCVVSGAPVTTRIEEDLSRLYLAQMPELPTGDEIEMPDDDTIEALPATLDLLALVYEAVAIALPAYPRADGVEMEQTLYGPPGADPLSDEAMRPFAGLAALKSKLEGNDEK